MKEHIYYVAIGDSLTKGIGTTKESDSFPAKYFNAIKKTHLCQYMNLGCSGMNSKELLEYIQGIRNELKAATDITITVGGNDFIQAFHEGQSLSGYIKTNYKLKQNLEKLLSQITSINPDAFTILMGLYNPMDPLDSLYNLCNKLHDRVNQMFFQLTKKYGISFVNPYSELLNKRHLFADEIHPNDNGYEVLAQLFIDKKRESLSRKQPVP